VQLLLLWVANMLFTHALLSNSVFSFSAPAQHLASGIA
jgi:hypothetical protein